MPTILSHAVVGSALGLLRPREARLGRLLLVLAALPILPDLDVIGFRFGIAYGDPLGHRGFTHSILFAGIAAILVKAVVFRGISITSRSGVGIVALCFLATMSHGVLDAFTDAGLGVGFFIPFENSRYFFPWRPIETSPLSISSFLGERGLNILANEAFWIGIPLALFCSIVGSTIYVVKRIRRRQ